MAAIVTAEGLQKSFARRGSASPPVLDGLDLELEEGAVLALLGPNGAGKTTTVRILSTLLRPDAGRATVAGFDVVREARQVRQIISLTGQQVAVDDKQSGAENLTMMGRLAHLPRRVVRERVAELLTAFDLSHAAHRQVGTWSGGMRRRLDLAAGLLTRPRVMFLDEPTTGLDPRSRQALWDVVRGVVDEGTSVFLTTQYLEEADRLAQRVALVDGGRIVAEGTPAQLKRQVGEAGVELTFATASDADRVAPALGVATVDGTRVRVPTDGSVGHVRAVLSAVEAAGPVPEHWEVRAPSLDDVFLTLTGHVGQESPARTAEVAA
ncbi:ATP-binding cassette domain-containing protein [Promicromonospora iranensis]|uniref:ATP-binding cassette domain-containing protein n=1 Tax=Promicromonospora iranensis TaxID=1105144 RepID=UPI0023A9F427|nr:ATP-binding cassette domain-containing protein [Promicromonospora iranensis]